MKLLTHPAVTALGLAMLYLLAILGPLTSSTHRGIYHWSGPAYVLFLPGLLCLCLVWLVVTLLLLFARGTSRLSVAIWSGLVVPLPWIILKNWSVLTGNHVRARFSASFLVLTLAVVVAIVMSWKPAFVPAFERLRQLMATTLGFVAISSLFVLGQFLWFGWQARNLNAPLPLHQRQSITAQAKTRIVWILFDELSYRQVYEQRFPGLELPAFDRLAAQSTVFTQVVPAGTMTENVLPSLFTAQLVDSIRTSSDGIRLSLHDPVSHAWRPFDPHRTVFQDALDAGYSTAIVGWYNPYCRILPQVLDQCFWTFNTPGLSHTSPGLTVAQNLLAPFHHAITSTLSLVSRLQGIPVYNRHDASLHQLDYTQLYSAADRLLNDTSANFVFLHMPIPHPGGIYDRTTGNFATTHSTYIDNLALADKYLAHVRAVLEQNGTWDSSTIVIMGDHSWRTSFMWAPMPSWTHEEQVASDGGKFDDRPAYIVKLPHQQQTARIDAPYAAIHTRALLEALMQDRIRSTGDLTTWAEAWNKVNKPTEAASR